MTLSTKLKFNSANLITLLGVLVILYAQLVNLFLPSFKLPILFVFIFFNLILITKNGDQTLFGLMLIAISPLLLIYIGGLMGYDTFSENMKLVFFYLSILIGFCFATNFHYFYKHLKIFIIINLFLMVYEFTSMSYIFEPTSDLSHFAGRAKGLISYSKEAGAMALIVTILALKHLDVKWLTVLLCFSFLTGSRLAIIGVFFAIMVEFFSRVRFKDVFSSKKLLMLVFIISFVLLVGYYYLLSESSKIIIGRLYESFNTSHSSNSERINFWIEYLNIFSNFNLLQAFFGYPGAAFSSVNNGAESAWLNLLTDGGVIAVIIYMFAVVCLFALMGGGIKNLFLMSLIVISMQISRVNIGFLDGTIFWAFAWYLLIRNLKSEKGYYLKSYSYENSNYK